MKFLFLCSAVLSAFLLNAQDVPQAEGTPGANDLIIYDTDLLPNSFFKSRRQALRDSLPQRSVAVVFSYPVRKRSGDMDYAFHQNPDLYYLTGLNEPNALLIIFKEEQQVDTFMTNEILFVQPKNPAVELWSGKRMGVDMARRLLGIQAVLPNTAFSDMPLTFKGFDKITYTPLLSDMQDDPRDRGDLSSLYNHFREKIPPASASVDVVFLHDKLSAMRQVKQQEELNLMIKAIDITCNAHRALMKAAEPGMYEYQAQAIIEYKFKTGGAEHPAFESICGSGENTCVLHYSTNRRKLNMGDLMVVDVGAEYHGYCADVTRTIPVSGTFSNDQKLIYEIVLAAQKAGIAQCRAGKKFWEPNDAAKEIIANGLLQLGIIHSKSEYHKYFMHGTSHYLGLDVHDVGQFNYLMKGNVITVEPGIYIPEGSDCDQRWWNIGVRIEDDVLITGGEPEVLSSSAPKEIAAIEELMRQTSPLRPVH